jgi:hypothetical protein
VSVVKPSRQYEQQSKASNNAPAAKPRWPNTRMQLTPLRVDEIGPILARNLRCNRIAIYQCGAADAQGVGRA